MDLRLMGVNASGEYVAELSIGDDEMNPWDSIAVLLEHPIVYFCGGGVDRYGFPKFIADDVMVSESPTLSFLVSHTVTAGIAVDTWGYEVACGHEVATVAGDTNAVFMKPSAWPRECRIGHVITVLIVKSRVGYVGLHA